MKKPEVTLENYQAVYDYYEHYTQPRLGALVCHHLLGSYFKPEVDYGHGVQNDLTEHLGNGSRIVLAWNHLRDTDQYVIAAAAIKEAPLRPMIANTFIQSKESIFNDKKKREPLRTLQRFGADVLGGLPTFRKKDIAEMEAIDIDLRDDFYKKAISRLHDVTVSKMVGGQHMAIFPEGERNRDNPETVQLLKPGLARTVGVVAVHCDVVVVPVGFTYGHKPRRPHVHFGQPIVVEGRLFDQNSFLETLQDSMQDSVDQARQRVGL